jgi:Flp pilus assembly protein TadD
LLRGEPLTGSRDPAPLPDTDVLGLDDDMRRFVASHVNPRASREMRLRQLLDAVMGGGSFGVDYEERTYTAAETFRRRVANCLSFTSMFVALGREAGLNVSFQEVDIPPDWSRDGASLVLNQHIDALVRDGDGRDRVVDFNIEDFRSSYDRRRVSDARALAHFYNNRAVEHMQSGDTIGALRHFRRALGHDAAFTPAWINLGSLYLRNGEPEWALSAWQHALALRPGESVALSNLERLHRQQGRFELADELRGRIERHRMRNPYYRYFLARQAFEERDYGAAIAHLEFAAREKRDEDQFAALLGLSYLRQGNLSSARRWLARAEAVAGDEQSRRNYHGKLAKLRQSGPG